MNILIATDGSEYASNALSFMLRFPFPRDSKMTVLTVVEDIPMLPAELDALDDVQNEALNLANKRLQEEAEEIINELNKHNIPLFGFYSGVEIAPMLGRSRGLDWTSVLIILAS